MNEYMGGTGSAQTGVARPPSSSIASANASAEPSASDSGFSWHTHSTSRAPRSRSTTAAGTLARSSAVKEVRPATGTATLILQSPRRPGELPAWGVFRAFRHRSVATAPQIVEDAQQARALFGRRIQL